MRKFLVTCLAWSVVAAPVYAATSLAALFGGYTAPTAPAAPTSTVSVVSTTSPYYGFSSTGAPTSSYVGSVTTVTSLTSLFSGGGSVSTSLVNNMSGATYTPQYVSSAPTTYTTSYSAPTYAAPTGGVTSLSALFGGGRMVTPITQTTYIAPTVSRQVNLLSNPEPGTIVLMIGGLGSVGLLRLRAKRRAKV